MRFVVASNPGRGGCTAGLGSYGTDKEHDGYVEGRGRLKVHLPKDLISLLI
jgi:hypothetical protein